MKSQTPQRLAIEAAFTSSARPLGPQEVLEAAREQVPTLNRGTDYRSVRRTVEDLVF